MQLPKAVNNAIERLEKAGFETVLVGGAVRDALCGRTVCDWDLATAALPRETEAVFADCRVLETGLKHGTVTVLFDGLRLEITTYRTEGHYYDHRRPEAVHFTSSLMEDLRRRDFTMNAIAYHPVRGYFDPFGGRKDLESGMIRCVGEARERFSEDALRILRALRFASTLSLEIERETADAAFAQKGLLRFISAERLQEELTRLLCGKNVEQVLLQNTEVLIVPLPEISSAVGFLQYNPHHDRDVWAHTAAATAAVPSEPPLRWAALLHDLGKPETFARGEDGVGHFFGHAKKSALRAEEILQRLRFAAAQREQIVTLVRWHDLPIAADETSIRRLLRRFGEETVRQLLLLQKADTAALSPGHENRLETLCRAEAILEAEIAAKVCFSLRDLAINGNDLLSLGLRGKEIGNALESCLTAVVENNLPNEREAILQHVRALSL